MPLPTPLFSPCKEGRPRVQRASACAVGPINLGFTQARPSRHAPSFSRRRPLLSRERTRTWGTPACEGLPGFPGAVLSRRRRVPLLSVLSFPSPSIPVPTPPCLRSAPGVFLHSSSLPALLPRPASTRERRVCVCNPRQSPVKSKTLKKAQHEPPTSLTSPHHIASHHSTPRPAAPRTVTKKYAVGGLNP